MSLIATLLPDPLHVSRLRSAVRDRHEVRECADWSALMHACDQDAVLAVVIDLFAGGHTAFEEIRALKQRLPRIAVVAYVTVTLDRARDLFDAGRAGVDGLVMAGENDSPRSLLATVERAESRSLVGIIRRSLAGTDRLVLDATLLAVTRAHERLSPMALAQLLGQPRRVVTLRLAAHSFPPPQRLLTWGRLIVAAHLLEDRHRSAERVAALLAFPSGSAFRNTCQRYMHATPSQIRSRGGAAFVVRTMLRHVQSRLSMAGEPHVRSTARAPTVAI